MNENSSFDAEVTPPERAEYELSPANSFPWPPSGNQSFIDSLFATWRGATFHPSSFFSRMPEEEKIGPSLLYFLIIVVVVASARLFWRMVLPDVPLQEGSLPNLATAMQSISPLVGFLMSPVVQLVSLFIGAAITQLMLLMLLPGRGTYARTVRTYCYAYSPAVFVVVPYVGQLVATFWSLYVVIIGIRETHRTSTGRAVASVLVPGILLAVVFAILIVLVLATMVTLT